MRRFFASVAAFFSLVVVCPVDAETGRTKVLLDSLSKDLRHISPACSTNHKSIIVADHAGSSLLYIDPTDSIQKLTLSSPPVALGVHPTQPTAVVGQKDETLVFIDISAVPGRVLSSSKIDGSVGSLSVSSNGDVFFVRDDVSIFDADIHCWNASTGKVSKMDIDQFSAGEPFLRINREGNKLMLCHETGVVREFTVNSSHCSLTETAKVTGSTVGAGMNDCQFSTDARKILTAASSQGGVSILSKSGSSLVKDKDIDLGFSGSFMRSVWPLFDNRHIVSVTLETLKDSQPIKVIDSITGTIVHHAAFAESKFFDNPLKRSVVADCSNSIENMSLYTLGGTDFGSTPSFYVQKSSFGTQDTPTPVPSIPELPTGKADEDAGALAQTLLSSLENGVNAFELVIKDACTSKKQKKKASKAVSSFMKSINGLRGLSDSSGLLSPGVQALAKRVKNIKKSLNEYCANTDEQETSSSESLSSFLEELSVSLDTVEQVNSLGCKGKKAKKKVMKLKKGLTLFINHLGSLSPSKNDGGPEFKAVLKNFKKGRLKNLSKALKTGCKK